MKRLTIILTLLLFIGCSSQQVKPSVCDTIPTDSYSVICQISDKLGVVPEDVSGVLKVANVAGLATEKYTAQEAKEFINDIRVYLKRAQNGYGLLYATLVEFIGKKYGLLPPEVQAAIIILEQFGTVDLSVVTGADQVLSDYDFQMLYRHLDEQDVILASFLE